jgi:hypothetical protein
MTLFPKKFDRYLVPVFPSLDILAAVGIAWAAASIAHIAQRTAAVVSIIGCIALLNVAWFHPYNLIYFNQALGGVPRGVRTFSVGWGEGYDQVAAYLNQQPDITGVVTAATMMKTLNPYLRHGAQATTPRSPELPDKTGYVVVYIYQAQGTVFPPFDQFYPHARPLHTVTLHGVDYAWVYQVAPAVAHPRPATFGDTLYLRGFDITGNTQAGQTLTLHLFWQTESAPAADTWLFAHLLAPDGTRLFQLDLPYPTSTWGAHRFVTTELPVTIPPDTPPGTYPLLIGMYDDPASGQRLPLESATTAPPALDGENVLLLYEVRVGE